MENHTRSSAVHGKSHSIDPLSHHVILKIDWFQAIWTVFPFLSTELEKTGKLFTGGNYSRDDTAPRYLQPHYGNVTFHEQHSIGYGFPSLLLVTRASADVSELVFKHEWRSHECLKTIPTHPLRHTWPEVVMGNHTRSSAVHGRSFHKGLTKRSIISTLY